MKAHYRGQLVGSRILIKWQLHLQNTREHWHWGDWTGGCGSGTM